MTTAQAHTPVCLKMAFRNCISPHASPILALAKKLRVVVYCHVVTFSFLVAICQVTVRTSAHIMYAGQKKKGRLSIYCCIVYLSSLYITAQVSCIYAGSKHGEKKHTEVYKAALAHARTSTQTCVHYCF